MSSSNLLKTETSDLHVAVEQSIDWPFWLGSIGQYEQFLLRLVNFVPVVDRRLDEQLGVPEDWFRSRRRGEWALSDLQDLRSSGLIDTNDQPADELQTDSNQFAWIDEAPTAAGVLYVLEGSTMGGQHLCRIVQSSFPANAQVPLRYLGGYGKQTGHRWQQTKAWLDQFLVTTHDQTKAVEAAEKMFVVFREQLGSKNDEL